MPNVIDCAAVFDPVKILQDHTSPSAQLPHSVSSGTSSTDSWIPLKYSGRSYVFFLAPSANVATTSSQDALEASNDLRIIAKVADTLRFRVASLALRCDHQCFVEQIDIASGAQCITEPTLQQRASVSTMVDASVSTLDQVKPTDIIDSCWEFTATQAGLAAANMKFRIYDDKAVLRGNFVCTIWYMVQP
ncbi:AidA/PixA family protein [Trinickia dinghuensis]|uniref:Inclusion body protein n=1 Tax=Trinickia dinghuensis TaxID=2291023 RepID=A0A3D8K0R1_9BURK|nr:AidA/PixA family protein [Trinickia dinghuensis]RDU98672.1 hypothetical protein DWV00_10350 [Trinickia dinghuensis]